MPNKFTHPPRPTWPYFVAPVFCAALVYGLYVISGATADIEELSKRTFVAITAAFGWVSFCLYGIGFCFYSVDPTDSKHFDS